MDDFRIKSVDESINKNKNQHYVVCKKSITQLTYILGEEDPKKVIYDELGDGINHLPNVFTSQVLYAVAPTPMKKATILQPDDYRQKKVDEGRWQCVAGLVLKMGPTAFKYHPRRASLLWEGDKPEVGDWIYFEPKSSWKMGLITKNGVGIFGGHIWDSEVLGTIDDPECID